VLLVDSDQGGISRKRGNGILYFTFATFLPEMHKFWFVVRDVKFRLVV
jgi:hypothetical protein